LSEQQANSHNIIATMNGQRTGHLVFFSLSFRHTVVHSLSNPHSLQALWLSAGVAVSLCMGLAPGEFEFVLQFPLVSSKLLLAKDCCCC
jgi:hypothetical protein